MWNAALQWIRSVRSRNLKHVQTDILTELEWRDARRHAGEAEVSVHQQIGADDIVRSIGERDGAAIPIAGLLSVLDRAARGLLEWRRRNDIEVQNAEAPEHGELV